MNNVFQITGLINTKKETIIGVSGILYKRLLKNRPINLTISMKGVGWNQKSQLSKTEK